MQKTLIPRRKLIFWNRHRWVILLCLLITSFFVDSGKVGLWRLAEIILFLLIFMGLIGATRNPRGVARIAFGLIGFWGALSFVSTIHPGELVQWGLLGSVLLLLTGALYITGKELVRRETSDLEKLASAVFGYFLLAAIWGLLFTQLETTHAGSFALTPEDSPRAQLFYFSLVTITTLGYGDIQPITSTARLLAGLEAAFGTLYIAVMIGQIVGRFK